LQTYLQNVLNGIITEHSFAKASLSRASPCILEEWRVPFGAVVRVDGLDVDDDAWLLVKRDTFFPELDSLLGVKMLWGSLNLLCNTIGEDEFAKDGKGEGNDEEVVGPEAALVKETVFVSLGELLWLFFVHIWTLSLQ
jgi:hypothetical protein